MNKKTPKRQSPVPLPSNMTAEQFDKKLTKLGFEPKTFCVAIGCHLRTVQSWTQGRLPVPRHISILVNMMIDNSLTEKDMRP